MPTSHQVFTPALWLRPFVRCYLDVQMGVAGQPISCLLPAKTEQCIYISTGVVPSLHPATGGHDLLSARVSSTVRGSVSSPAIRLSIDGVLSMFVIVFHPGAFFRFFGIPSTHFSDSFTEAGCALGLEWEELGLRIREVSNPLQRVAMAEACLARHYKPADAYKPIDEMIRLLSADHSAPVHELARNAFLSERQFRRNFMERVGLPPQNFMRIARANRALHLRKQEPGKSWRSIAFETGYTDQSHLSRDMNNLMGMPSLSSDKFMDVNGTPFRVADA